MLLGCAPQISKRVQLTQDLTAEKVMESCHRKDQMCLHPHFGCLLKCGTQIVTQPIFCVSAVHELLLINSENLSKTFFAEMLVFDDDYEGKSSTDKSLL